ncbi:MAG: hypothetical protein LBQ50_07310 [Planctomycetaceae bacterium]|jgi:hypothetical protein|nr:hypothetical protein [Planctomycetaceae bacterium]
MLRTLRRQLRIWHKDISSGWGRLKTFHRIVLGIVITIAVIYGARKYWFDSISAAIAETQSKYDKSEPPNPLPTIETDSDIIMAQEQLIGREKTAADKKTEMERVAKSRPKITQQNKEAVLSELAAMISKNKLILLSSGISAQTEPTTKTVTPATKTTSSKKQNENTTKPKQETPASPEESPLKYEEHDYKIEGHFSGILNFLKQLETFAYPIKITQLHLGTPEMTPKTINDRRTEKLQLRFHLILYFHE